MRKTPGQPNPTNQLPIYFDILIDEPVVDFPVGPNASGVVIGGTATGLRSIAVSVPENVCADLFGNINYASTSEDATLAFDGTRPACVVQSEMAGVINNATMEITLAFSEPVYGLDDSAVSLLENATVRRKSGFDGEKQYVFEVTPVRDGIIAFQVPEDAVTDAVGNGNTASQIFSLIVDSTGPSVRLTSFETPENSNARYIRIHAIFSEPVTGFDKEDVRLASGVLQHFSAQKDQRTFILDVRPDRAPLSLSIPEGVATDSIGNPNRASEVFHRDYDAERPSVEIAVLAAGRYQGDPVPVEVRFSEPVFGFSAESLKVSGATAVAEGGGEGDSSYRFVLHPQGGRTVRLSVASGAVRDAAGNGNRSASAKFALEARPQVRVDAADESGAQAPPLIAR